MGIYRQLTTFGCFLMYFIAFSATLEAKKDLPNILLFTVDACRPDHFGCYGYSRNTTPNIDKLAKEGVLFTNAFSQSAWTTPGMISLFTSLYPPAHSVDAKDKTLDDGVPTLPGVLKRNGYQVPVLPKFVDIPNYWHLCFDTVDKKQFEDTEGEDLLKLLETYKDQKFFVWYHYHGLHLPYNPSGTYDKIFLEDTVNETTADFEIISTIKKKSVIKYGSIDFTRVDKNTIIALYDGQVKQLDDFMGRLIEKMKEWDVFDNTLIIITSDHGEELFEHGFIGHASTSLNAKLYDEIIRIPLIIWWHNKLKGKIVDDLVQQIDIMPTLLDMLGFLIPAGLQGRSLRPLIHGNDLYDPRPVFCETNLGGYQSTKEMEKIKLRCLRTKEWKLIYTNGLNSEKYELYDLRTDPGEKKDVVEKYPDVVNELKKKLFHWIETTAQGRSVSIR